MIILLMTLMWLTVPAPNAAALSGPDALTPADAAAHVGEKATVCGVVDDARYLESSKRQPTFLNFGGRYPNHQFTAVIFGADRAPFGTPERTWLGKRLCVFGPITLFNGKPQIIVKTVSEIEADEPVEKAR